jgi:hypothetical protein
LKNNPEIMVEISEKVLVAAGLLPGEDGGFTEEDDEPIGLGALDDAAEITR